MLDLKLLIVDDEKLDREGLLGQLDWSRHHITEVILAKNGPAALEIIKQQNITILFTDIKMPRMSGVELAQHAKQLNPDIKIVFISGYDDFQYMKSAIQISAYEYILKPVNTNELLICVKRIVNDVLSISKNQIEKKALIKVADEGLPLLRQKLMKSIIFGEDDDFENKMKEMDIQIEYGCMAVLLIEVDNHQIFPKSDLSKMIVDLQKIICTLPHRFDLLEAVEVEKDQIAVITGATIDFEKMEVEITAFANTILSHTISSFSVTIGVGGVVGSLRDLNVSYNRSVQAVISKLYKGKGVVLSFDGNDNEDGIDHVKKMDYEIANCLLKLDMTKAGFLLDRMFDNFKRQKNNDRQNIQYHCINIISRVEIILSEINVRIEDIIGENKASIGKLLELETISDIQQWMKVTIRTIIEYLDGKKNSKSGKIVGEVITYIEAKYAEDISLNAIARILFYSPNYLGNIFKQEIGQGFSEYLIEYRIKKAAELLRDDKKKVLEASLAVGYKDMPTFIKNFKAIYGVTPSGYRSRRAL